MIIPVTGGYQTRIKFATDVPDADIAKEPGLYNCSYEAAMRLGGPITRSFLQAAATRWQHRVDVGAHLYFDSRTHMLMPGMYPAIPGWHLDDVPRNGDGQPSFDVAGWDAADHLIGVVGADVSATEYMREYREIEVLRESKEQNVYAAMDATMKFCGPETGYIEDRHILAFTASCPHRAQPAEKRGWRWFGRLTYNPNRTNKPTNEVRTQSQVYLLSEGLGW